MVDAVPVPDTETDRVPLGDTVTEADDDTLVELERLTVPDIVIDAEPETETDAVDDAVSVGSPGGAVGCADDDTSAEDDTGAERVGAPTSGDGSADTDGSDERVAVCVAITMTTGATEIVDDGVDGADGLSGRVARGDDDTRADLDCVADGGSVIDGAAEADPLSDGCAVAVADADADDETDATADRVVCLVTAAERDGADVLVISRVRVEEGLPCRTGFDGCDEGD